MISLLIKEMLWSSLLNGWKLLIKLNISYLLLNEQGKHSDEQGEFAWSGCSENVRYGSSFARQFIDARERKLRDSRALMNLHNNRVGRKVL